MDGRKVAILETASSPRDLSRYWHFGYYKKGKIYVVHCEVETGKMENITTGDYAMGFDKPLIYKPSWGKLTGLVYDFVDITKHSINKMRDYDQAKTYNGLHCVRAI